MSNGIKSGQFLTFKIEEELFALEIFSVREILEVPEITIVPGMSDLIRGIVNIRGLVIPVIDIKKKFIDKDTEITKDSVIIVIEVKIDGDISLMGIMADAAESVISLTISDIEQPPKLGMAVNKNYLKGIGKTSKGFALLLDTETLFSEEEIIISV
ncbi:MAG: chemotaxis protein CheW [Spirochaetales bacterium]|nr:chemotaxis protein CheW [Spirochaetales bacterium]